MTDGVEIKKTGPSHLVKHICRANIMALMRHKGIYIQTHGLKGFACRHTGAK